MDKRHKLLVHYKSLLEAKTDADLEIIELEGLLQEAEEEVSRLQGELSEEKYEQRRIDKEIAHTEALLATPDSWVLLPVEHKDYQLWRLMKAQGIEILTNKWVIENFNISAPTAGLRLLQATRAGLLEKIDRGTFRLRDNVSEAAPPDAAIQKEVEQAAAETAENLGEDPDSAPGPPDRPLPADATPCLPDQDSLCSPPPTQQVVEQPSSP